MQDDEDEDEDGAEEARETAGESSAVTTEEVDVDALPEPVDFNSKCGGSSMACPDTLAAKSLLPEWYPFKLHAQLGRALYTKKFTTPTPIQAQTLPLALKNKDVVGVAETVCLKSPPLPAIIDI